MYGIDDAAVALGSVVVQAAIKLWLGDRSLAADIASSATDALAARASDLLRKRQTVRMIDRMTDIVVEKLEPYLKVEFGHLPENERIAAIYAVQDTFQRAALTDNDLFAHDLNASYLDKYLRRTVPDVPRDALLAEAASSLYDVLLRECCEYIVQIIVTLPTFQPGILTEILRRETEIINLLIEILERLPKRQRGRGVSEFEVDYRRQVRNRLDSMELFGATLSTASRRYPLSVAYISLSVSGANETPVDKTATKAGLEGSRSEDNDDAQIGEFGIPIESALTSGMRLFVRGEAGRGKTSLLKWIAVRSASRDFPEQLSALNDTTPFFISLRSYVDSEPPTPELFLANLGRHIADEMPHGWVHDLLRSGKAIVLIDGVDEVPAAQRDRVREWLKDLVDTFPESRYVVTSRSGAAGPDWLNEEQFLSLELQPMTSADIRSFIHQWHNAIRSQVGDSDEIENIDNYERWLIEKLNIRRYLRFLAETPLLCALLCALHLDRRAHLPQNRIELYEVALDMLLERRDAEQRVATDITLSRTHKTLLLQDIAYWLARNGRSQVDKAWVINRLAKKLPIMSIPVSPSRVYRNLLERSGLLREPVADHVDFVHRSFQEYLAALDALAQDDIPFLVDNAHFDQWREIVIMAAGRAYPGQREKLLEGLIHRGDSDPSHKDQLYLLALACLETSPQLKLEIREEIRRKVKYLLPPQNITTAKSLALAGEFVADLLSQARPVGARETALTVRAAAEIGDEAGFEIIKKYRRDRRSTVQSELMRAWPRFDPHEYAKEVMIENSAFRSSLRITDPDILPAVMHFPDLIRLSIDFHGDIDLSPIGSLEKLRTLWIQAQSREIEGLVALENLGQLDVLDLGGVPVADLEPLRGLDKLRTLYLYRCGLTDISPLSGLTKLRLLDLSGNQISDLSALASMSDMDDLRLANTAVRDVTPLRQLTKISKLILSVSHISDAESLSGLINLKELDFSSTNIESLTFLASFSELTKLEMRMTGVRDLSPMSSLSKLTSFDAGATKINDIRPLANLQSVETLVLDDTEISDVTPLGDMNKLHFLNLKGTPTENVSALAGAVRLSTLQLARTNVNDISVVARMPHLHTLDISRTRVRDISALSELKWLRTLNIYGAEIQDLTPLSGTRVSAVIVSSALRDKIRVPDNLKVYWVSQRL